jgi:hypothetical protein
MAAKQSSQSSNGKVDIAVIQADIAYIRNDISEIKKALTDNYVTKDQFRPVKNIAYGAVSLLALIVVAALGALATLTKGKT